MADSSKLRTVVVGDGVAALETILALTEIAPDVADVALLTPTKWFAYRPMTVREPFAYAPACHYPLRPIVVDAGAELIADTLSWIDPSTQVLYTKANRAVRYDALVLAAGAHTHPRYTHALTIDDRHLDELLRGLVRDVEGGSVHRLAFVAPGRMAWPLPLYELALMTAGRAHYMGVALAVTIVTPEDAPLAIFGSKASESVTELLARANIQTIASAHAEVPDTGSVVISPGDRHLSVDRVVALPEFYGPCLRGIPLGEHGFIRTDVHGCVRGVPKVYAAGDATDFAVKHGGIAAQQADIVAQSIAALAGANVTPEPFHPVIRGMLPTADRPRYLTARITGRHGFHSEISDAPAWSSPKKIVARYLAPRLERFDTEHHGGPTPAESDWERVPTVSAPPAPAG